MSWFTKNTNIWISRIIALWDSLTVTWDSTKANWDSRGVSKWYNKKDTSWQHKK